MTGATGNHGKQVTKLDSKQTEPLALRPDEWMDSPLAIIEQLVAQEEGDIVFDGSTAGTLPAQVAQLLVSCHNTAAERGAKLQILNPSEAVQQSLAGLGLGEILLGDESE